MRSIAVIAALLGIVVFSKVYFQAPSARDGEQVVSKFVEDHSAGSLRLANFKQTGGKEILVGGIRLYVMTFEGVLECTAKDPSPEQTKIEFAFDHVRDRSSEPMHSGESKMVKGAIQFEKSSFAWVGQPM